MIDFENSTSLGKMHVEMEKWGYFYFLVQKGFGAGDKGSSLIEDTRPFLIHKFLVLELITYMVILEMLSCSLKNVA